MSSKTIKWAPEHYQDTNVIAELSGKELIARLSWMMLQPNSILDVACGLSSSPEALAARYPRAQLIKLDYDPAMFSALDMSQSSRALVGDCKQLPLKSASVDLLFANLILPWQQSLEATLKEWQRVLMPEGILLFSALGPDTLKSWQPVFQDQDFVFLHDMHDIGDLLLAMGFLDPVLDVEHVTLSYRDYDKLLYELVGSGIWRPDDKIYSQLFQNQHSLPTLDLHYEIIYGHAFAPQQFRQSPEQFSIPLSTLRAQLKK